MLFNKTIKIALGILLCTSCTSSLYKPTVVDVPDTAEFQMLQTGRSLYINNCNNCHNLHLPDEYDANKWREIVTKMQKKAKISDSDAELIYKYLTFKKPQN